MNRRSFLAALAAPLIARPTLEDIERLTWRRRYWPGWSPTYGAFSVGDIVTIAGRYAVDPYTRKALDYLQLFVVTSRHSLFPIPEGPVFRASDIRPVLCGETRWSGQISLSAD